MNNAKKMSEYRVAVNMNVKIDLYVNARSEAEATANAEEIMYDNIENDTILCQSTPDGATGLDIEGVYCNISSAVEME